MVSKIKDKYKEKYIKLLQDKKMIINEKNKNKFEMCLINYGAETIINDFKLPFIYDSERNLFLNDTECKWIMELFNFDNESSNYVLNSILSVERRLANAVSIIIEESIIEKKSILFQYDVDQI